MCCVLAKLKGIYLLMTIGIQFSRPVLLDKLSSFNVCYTTGSMWVSTRRWPMIDWVIIVRSMNSTRSIKREPWIIRTRYQSPVLNFTPIEHRWKRKTKLSHLGGSFLSKKEAVGIVSITRTTCLPDSHAASSNPMFLFAGYEATATEDQVREKS